MPIETEFTPVASAVGGALIGLAAGLLMLMNGRIAGISGIIGRLIMPAVDSKPAQALAFVVGIIAAPLLWTAVLDRSVDQTLTDNLLLAAIAGLLVGFGAAYGGGCTSGHGVCGLARLSPRSVVATAIFMTTAILVVFVSRHLIGGGP